MKNYDYEKENFKNCPVCSKTIDYHFDGFYHDQVLNVWICRDHKLEDINKCIKLKDEKLIRFIQDGEADLVCPRCAGRELVEPADDAFFELKECSKCGGLTAVELGALRV